MSLLAVVAAWPVRFYRRFITPFKPPTCRFYPSCSLYALDALREHGFFKGALLSVWRLLRCQPLCRGGYDPVPPPGRWRPERPQTAASGPPEPGERK